MSLMSFMLIGTLLFILFNHGETIPCPTQYNPIGMGCYKIITGPNSKETWFNAGNYCVNDFSTLPKNETVPTARTHLIALENVMEKTALLYWMTSYQMYREFWTDGIVSLSSWNWSNQSITWYFDASERAIIGNGSNYKLAYNYQNQTYQIADDVSSKKLDYICEYQIPCDQNNSCVNNATCYSNVGLDLCLCTPGFTGQYCEIIIDECLSSPCLHGGDCVGDINNYTCNCSDAFYDGPNCETPKFDPTQNNRSTAFWAVLGIVIGLVVLLTLSDLPCEDIMTAIGCSCHSLKCCFKQDNVEDINENDLRLSDSPTNDQNYGVKKISMPSQTPGSKGTNYHVMTTVWDSDHMNNQTPINSQYNGYRSPDQSKTFNNSRTQSFSAITIAKQKQSETKPIYAVNINEPKSKTKDPVDTMVNWTQQLQEQLRNKKPRETSASSTKQLIHSTNSNDY